MSESENKNILLARDLHKSFGRGAAKVHVLRGLDLTVRRGEFLAVMGPSGCGKSTLLHVLGLMTGPDEGRIVLDSREVPDDEPSRTLLRRRHIGFVFQRFNLLGVLNAADNIRISLRVRGLEMDGRAEEVLDQLGLADLARRKPAQMSTGEQQRLAVGRALAHHPELILADEPTGNLDSDNARRLLELLRQVNRQETQTIVMVTHSATAAETADRIVRMADGKIVDTNV
jgi:putative ABC transport system ATP-binding protein